MKILAQIISYIFHPLLMPTYAFFYVMYLNPEGFSGIETQNSNASTASTFQNKLGYNLILIQVFINSFIFPAIAILIMKGLGMIESLEMKTREERYIPIISTMVFIVWTYVVFMKSNHPEILSDIMLASLFGLVVAFISNALKVKISLHAIGAGTFFSLAILTIGFATTDAVPYLLLVIFIAGLICTSRLILKAHDTKELYFGFLVGMMCLNIAFIF